MKLQNCLISPSLGRILCALQPRVQCRTKLQRVVSSNTLSIKWFSYCSKGNFKSFLVSLINTQFLNGRSSKLKSQFNSKQRMLCYGATLLSCNWLRLAKLCQPTVPRNHITESKNQILCTLVHCVQPQHNALYLPCTAKISEIKLSRTVILKFKRKEHFWERTILYLYQ